MIGNIAVTRQGAETYPLKPLYGPNVARELLRNQDEHKEAIDKVLKDNFVPKVMHELDRELKRQKQRRDL